jgi:hypothetical protein
MVTAILGAVLWAAGCASEPKPAPRPVPVAAMDQYTVIKTAYLQANPDARVGRVAAVLPDQARLAVADVPVSDFHRGDILSVVDAKLNPLATGSVVDMDSDMLYLQYTPVAGSSRAPLAGDLAVRAAP